MSCSVPVFACIQDVERVISILNDAPTTGEEDVKESTGESDKLFTNDTLFQNRLHNESHSCCLLYVPMKLMLVCVSVSPPRGLGTSL